MLIPETQVPRQVDDALKAIMEKAGVQAVPDQAQAPAPEPAPEPAPAPTVTPVKAPEPAPGPPVAPVEPLLKGKDGEPWEQRFKSLDGRIEKEHRLRKEAEDKAQETQRQLEEYKRLVEDLEKRRQPGEPELNVSDLGLSQETIETLGEENVMSLLAAARKAVMKDVSGEFQVLHQAVQNMKEERYRSVLIMEAPDWEALNTDAGFHQWLNQAETIGGRTRKENLLNAADAMDGKTVAAYFRAYKESSPAAPAPVAPASIPAVPRSVPRQEAPAQQLPQMSLDALYEMLRNTNPNDTEALQKIQLMLTQATQGG